MHEAGIAVAVAAEIRERALDPARVRLLVSGGHGNLADFDAALRAHLETAAPGARLAEVRIVHLPAPHVCAHCAGAFEAVAAAPAGPTCPACGGPGMRLPQAESIELAWDEAPDSQDEPGSIAAAPPEGPEYPPPGDSRPSTPAPSDGRLWP
jgi:Zn finger protein HypA/HybF involved in hydrogenase expression